jgi:cytochrome bd-type quinol oxidase subunit 1
VDVSISLVSFTLLYSTLAIIMVRLMLRFAREGTEAALQKSVDVAEPGTVASIPLYVGVQD